MIWIPISIIALLFIIVLVIIYFFNMAFVRGKITNILERAPHNSEFEGYYDEIRKGIEWFDKADKESVYINSYDGLKLHAYLIRCENADKTPVHWESPTAPPPVPSAEHPAAGEILPPPHGFDTSAP